MADNLKGVRDQGLEAHKHNQENSDKDGNPIGGARLFTEHDCPYGPGDARDAWIAGLGGVAEEVKQADTSTANSADVREKSAETVREPAKAKGSKAEKAKKEANRTAVTTDTTGTGETALTTTVAPANPEQTDMVPNPETTVGDPSASTHPAAIQHVDEASGNSEGPSGPKPADLM